MYTVKLIIIIIIIKSRRTVVCRAAQEVGAPHSEYINKKKENAIFTPVIPYPIGIKFFRDVPPS